MAKPQAENLFFGPGFFIGSSGLPFCPDPGGSDYENSD
jgi:hypothetical protein